MVSLTKLAEDYKNKEVVILQEKNDKYYYFYPNKEWNCEYLSDEQFQQFKAIYRKKYYVPKVVDVEAEIEKDEKVEKVKKQKPKVEEVPKQADEENKGSKYSVHVTFWRDTGDENKPIVPIREGTYTINAKSEHTEKLKNYKNIKNYTYNFVKFYVGDNHAFKNKPAKLIKYQTGAGPNRDQTVPIEQENYEFIRKNFIDYLPTELEKNLFELNMYLSEYISFDKFVKVNSKKKNMKKAKLRSELCETINNKAIDYKGKSLKQIIKNNELNDNLKSGACSYTSLIQ
eukprot:gene12800-7071_t